MNDSSQVPPRPSEQPNFGPTPHGNQQINPQQPQGRGPDTFGPQPGPGPYVPSAHPAGPGGAPRAKKSRRHHKAGIAIAASIVAAALVGFGGGYFAGPSHVTVEFGAQAAPNSQGSSGSGSSGQGWTGNGSSGQGSSGQGSSGQGSSGQGSSGQGSSGQGSSGQGSSGGQYGYGGQNGFPGTGQNGGTQNGQSSENGRNGADTSRATKAQSRGIVEITTVLKYEGAKAAGTGMILTSNGEILTNNHVVEGSTSIKATVASTGKTYKARVVGTDKKDDVAVLKLTNASSLKTVRTDTDQVDVGDQVVGIGNAGGTGSLTAAAGKVTALNQQITTMSEGTADSETLAGLIQTSANVQAGDSGGPLVDTDGEVVGMDTAASTNSQTGASTSGYAIPIASALKIADTIESGHETNTVSIGYPAFLGIELGRATGETTGRSSRVDGALVAGVIPSTPAAAAGLQAGDVITQVGNTSIGSAKKLSATLDGYDPGQSAVVHWTDVAGATHQATVTLVNGPVE